MIVFLLSSTYVGLSIRRTNLICFNGLFVHVGTKRICLALQSAWRKQGLNLYHMNGNCLSNSKLCLKKLFGPYLAIYVENTYNFNILMRLNFQLNLSFWKTVQWGQVYASTFSQRANLLVHIWYYDLISASLVRRGRSFHPVPVSNELCYNILLFVNFLVQ